MLLLHSTIPAYCRPNLGSARYLHLQQRSNPLSPGWNSVWTKAATTNRYSAQLPIAPWTKMTKGGRVLEQHSCNPRDCQLGGSQFIFGHYFGGPALFVWAHAWLASNNGSSSQYVDASLTLLGIPIVTSLVTEQNSVFCPNNNVAHHLVFRSLPLIPSMYHSQLELFVVMNNKTTTGMYRLFSTRLCRCRHRGTTHPLFEKPPSHSETEV